MQLEALFVKGAGLSAQQVKMAVHNSYKRLLSLSIETEIRLSTKSVQKKKPSGSLPGICGNSCLPHPLDRKISLPLTQVFAQGVRWFA